MRLLHPCGGTAELEELYAYPHESRPWVRANMVASADGAATAAGHTAGLSSPGDRNVFQLLRGMADVILVGAGTARIEGYGAAPAKREWQRMRDDAGQPPAPAIAVVSASLDLDPDSPLFTGAHPQAGTIVFTAAFAPPERRRRLEKVADVITAGEKRVDPATLVAALHARGQDRVLCEGGPTLLATVATADHLDELCLTLSPVLTAGDATRITSDHPMPEPRPMRLLHVLEDGGSLFLRYTRG